MAALPEVVNLGFVELGTTRHQHPLLSSRVFGHKLAASTASGARYPKHLDNTLGAPHDTRKLTAIIYLNPEHEPSAHGGALRLYDALEGSAPRVYTDLEPLE